jgi:hypothetical protein
LFWIRRSRTGSIATKRDESRLASKPDLYFFRIVKEQLQPMKFFLRRIHNEARRLGYELSRKTGQDAPPALHWISPSGEIIGGGERDRTDDLLLAKQALSQLSYTPEETGGSGWI